MRSLRHLYLLDLDSDTLYVREVFNSVPLLHNATVDTRQLANSTFTHSLKHSTLRFSEERHRMDKMVLFVTDFPRESALQDYVLVSFADIDTKHNLFF